MEEVGVSSSSLSFLMGLSGGEQEGEDGGGCSNIPQCFRWSGRQTAWQTSKQGVCMLDLILIITQTILIKSIGTISSPLLQRHSKRKNIHSLVSYPSWDDPFLMISLIQTYPPSIASLQIPLIYLCA